MLTGLIIVIFACVKLCFDFALPWTLLFVFIPVFFLLSFFILRYVLFYFIYRHIRLIYKTIHSFKEDDQAKKEKFDINKDLLRQVDDDVTQWAENSRKEIQEWKRMAQYRKEFVGNVSHELKTPIFNIQGYTLTLLEGGIADKSINIKYLEKLEKNINRIISIVNDLEDFSKLEHGDLKLWYVSFDPVELIDEVFDNLEDKAAIKNIRLNIHRHYEKQRKISADPEFLRQVITNLVINAINYGKEDGFVNVELFDMDENLLIEVTDNGIGISEADIPRIFERFYRVDKSLSTYSGGTGLGLSIVKHIIEAHNQTLNVRSTLGVGTTIAFTMKKAK
ncbi:MAG: ATP-binding protein [Candidatus Delongbacteria bacterium]|jgi:two-component system phosphate regulon sensor histidine kinase PhoR|nr:ATP-binding protein [Candidatus Delongbacteria bacterium]